MVALILDKINFKSKNYYKRQRKKDIIYYKAANPSMRYNNYKYIYT